MYIQLIDDINCAKKIYLQLMVARRAWDKHLIAGEALIYGAENVVDQDTQSKIYKAVQQRPYDDYKTAVFTAILHKDAEKFNLKGFYDEFDATFKMLKDAGKIGNVMMHTACHCLLKYCEAHVIRMLHVFDEIRNYEMKKGDLSLGIREWFELCEKDIEDGII